MRNTAFGDTHNARRGRGLFHELIANFLKYEKKKNATVENIIHYSTHSCD